MILDFRAEGHAVDQDVDVRIIFFDILEEPGDRIVAMLLIAAVAACLLIHVRHGVEGHVTSKNLVDFERAGTEWEHPAVGIGFALEDAFDNADQARMASEHQACAGSLQGLGNEPGKANIVANAGNQGYFAGEIDRNHALPRRTKISGQPTAGLGESALGLANLGIEGKEGRREQLPAGPVAGV